MFAAGPKTIERLDSLIICEAGAIIGDNYFDGTVAFANQDPHRWLGTLSIIDVAIHLVALITDSYVHFGIAEVLVPMTTTWRPGAVA